MKRICTSTSISGQAITMNGVNVVKQAILLIANATKGSVLYNIGGTAPTAYSQGTNSIITLASSAVMSTGDAITIYYDDSVIVPTTPVSQSGTWNVVLPVGQQAKTASTSVVVASDQIVPVTSQVSSTAAVTSITSAGTTTIAASSTRTGLIFFNAGANAAYVLLGSGAISTTNFTFTLNTGDTIALNSYTGAYKVLLSGTPAFLTTTLSP
jgi:hypothetical protein